MRENPSMTKWILEQKDISKSWSGTRQPWRITGLFSHSEHYHRPPNDKCHSMVYLRPCYTVTSPMFRQSHSSVITVYCVLPIFCDLVDFILLAVNIQVVLFTILVPCTIFDWHNFCLRKRFSEWMSLPILYETKQSRLVHQTVLVLSPWRCTLIKLSSRYHPRWRI